MTKKEEIIAFLEENVAAPLLKEKLPFKIRVGIKTAEKQAQRMTAEELVAMFQKYKDRIDLLDSYDIPPQWKEKAKQAAAEFEKRFC